MVIAVPLGKPGESSALLDPADVEIQSLPTQYGLGRINTETAVGHGRVSSTSADP